MRYVRYGVTPDRCSGPYRAYRLRRDTARHMFCDFLLKFEIGSALAQQPVGLALADVTDLGLEFLDLGKRALAEIVIRARGSESRPPIFSFTR